MHKKALARLLMFLGPAGVGACSSDSGQAAAPPDASQGDVTQGTTDARAGDVANMANDSTAQADGNGARDGGPSSDGNAGAGDGGDAVTYVVCLADTSPTFANLRTNLFAVSCTSGSQCHGTAAATATTLRGGGGLDLESDAYTHLLGADGMGAPATNQEGAAQGLIRVKPGNPDNSFLMIKLQLMTNTDNDFGSGMPFPTPGSVCPSTLSTIRTWIAQGAANN